MALGAVLLFVIAVVQFVRASADFIDKFIRDEPDHAAENGEH